MVIAKTAEVSSCCFEDRGVYHDSHGRPNSHSTAQLLGFPGCLAAQLLWHMVQSGPPSPSTSSLSPALHHPRRSLPRIARHSTAQSLSAAIGYYSTNVESPAAATELQHMHNLVTALAAWVPEEQHPCGIVKRVFRLLLAPRSRAGGLTDDLVHWYPDCQSQTRL